jgi:hypothetical protein
MYTKYACWLVGFIDFVAKGVLRLRLANIGEPTLRMTR